MTRFHFLRFLSAALVGAALVAAAHAGPPRPDGGTDNFLLVADWGGDKVLRYDGATGAFVDTFVPKHNGGMNQPYGILFGPHDGDLYVSTGEYSGPGQLKAVLRYDGATGAFIDRFTVGGNLTSPRGIIFGPDGNLYVTDRKYIGQYNPEGRVARFDGHTGVYIDDFVPRGSGGLTNPAGLVFGPDGDNPGDLDLYVTSGLTQNVLRYDGTTGAFLGEFVASSSGGLGYPVALTFGPDDNLYVAAGPFGSDEPEAVFRFQGPSGESPGAFIDIFVPAGSGGLQFPFGLIFGPDGNGDEHFDLYVANSVVNGASFHAKKATVKRYDGVTGAFIDTFVTQGSGRLDDVGLLTFTQTDPVTLNYLGVPLTKLSSGAIHAVPEPASIALLVVALPLVLLLSERHRKDGVWDIWHLEGPSFVWHYCGAPDVHVWVNIADDPGVKLNA